MGQFIQVLHHDKLVWGRDELVGKHREHCNCFFCSKIHPLDREKNCHIANSIFENCVKFGVVTPVYECPEFAERLSN